MTNYEIADQFALISKLMDIHGQDAFRSKSYSIAAYHIERLPREAAEMDDSELFSQKGIGERTGTKIRALIEQGGQMEQLSEWLEKTPPGVLDMLKIKGLGPKKISMIWKTIGIDNLGELEYACHENRLAGWKGFGLKTQQSILESIEFFQKNQGLHLYAQVIGEANELLENFRKAFADHRWELSGDLRRQTEIIDHLSLITDTPADELKSLISSWEEMTMMEDEEDHLKFRWAGSLVIQCFFSSKSTFGSRWLETTGSPEFITALRHQYTWDTHLTEQAFFEGHELPFIPPALRESASSLERVIREGHVPKLIQREDIRGIIHAHSRWSDGLYTIREMALAAIKEGFEYLVISDHSQAATYANGLSPERLAQQIEEIDSLNKELAPFRVFKSIESDILGDGSLDYPDEILSQLDLVIASVHSNLKMTAEKAEQRLIRAISHPMTTILGHPTGRLLLSRPGYPIDHKRMIDACAKHGVVIEINAHPKRLDLDWRWIAYAMDKGVMLSIDPDAHSIQGFQDIGFGVLAAQKGGLTAEWNLSSLSRTGLEAFLAKGKAG